MSISYIVKYHSLRRNGKYYNCQTLISHVAPPGQPQSLSVDLVKATSFGVSWAAPFEADSPISHYVINAVNLNGTGVMSMVVTANTTTNATSFNVTGLLPGTTYEMAVVAASQGGDIVAKSLASDPVVDSTDVTGQLVNKANHMRVVVIISSCVYSSCD